MKIIWALPLALAAMTVSSIAIAQDSPGVTAELQSVTGEVQDIDRGDGTITVRPGGVFTTPEGWQAGDVRRGTLVRIRYTTEGDRQIAVSIVRAF